MFEKPSELMLFRPVELGGLGLHNIRCKALASRLTSFLQTATNSCFQPSAYHSALYQYHCCNNEDEGTPTQPPYYPQSFFSIIQDMKENTSFNPEKLSVKEWYQYLLQKQVTHQHALGDPALPLELRLSRREEQEPGHDWQRSYDLARRKGLDPGKKSFAFKLLNGLLPYRERTAEHQPNTSPACPHCPAPQPSESSEHYFFHCGHNQEAGEAVLALLLRPVDQTLDTGKAVRLEVTCDGVHETAAVLILLTGLNLIHTNRKENKRTSVQEVTAELESLCGLLRRARARKLQETTAMVMKLIN